MRYFLRRRMYSLWGSTPTQNHQLPSGDYAVAQGMFHIAYQRHQRSTMHIEKGSVANRAQRNPSTAKVHNLSCKSTPKRLFSHSNKGQLQSGTDRSTNEVTKQDVTQKNRLYRSVLRSRPTPCNISLLQAQSKPTFLFKNFSTGKE